MKKIFSTIFVTFCLLLVTLLCSVTLAENIDDTDVFDNLLRIHVIANSDSVEDQNVKLKVRDAVLSETKNLFYDCKSLDDAVCVAEQNKGFLEDVAKEALKKCKKEDAVRVEIGKKSYNERKLCGVTFPCGEYMSLRVVIGNGEGRNWWGVLFPSAFSVTDDEKSGNVGKTIFGCRVKLKIFDYLN